MRRRILAVAVVVAAVVVVVWRMSSCGSHRVAPVPIRLEGHSPVPYPGPPASLQVQLRADGDAVVLEQAVPRDDGMLAFHVEDHIAAVRDGIEALYDCRILAASGALLATARFVIPLRGRVTYLPPTGPRRVVHDVTKPVTPRAAIALPYHRDAAVLEVTRLLPGAGAVDTWKRGPTTRLDLQPVRPPAPGGVR